MRRNRLWLCTVASGALLLPVGILAGLTPAGAASAPDPLQTTVQDVESAAAAAVQTTVPDEAATAPATSSGAATADSTAPLAGLPISLSAPITALANEIGATSLPAQDETSGTNTTTQTSPAANVDAPINACSFSIGLAADATSSCSTTAVGVNQTGGIGSVNVPVTAQDNAIGLVNQMASALGLTTGQSSGGGEQMYLRDAASPKTYVAVWMKRETNTAAETDAWLELAVKLKRDQRTGGGVIPGFSFRPESVQHEYIGDHKAVKAVADFVQGTQQTVEYFTWVYTERTRVQFDVRGVDPDAASTASRFEEIIQAAKIP